MDFLGLSTLTLILDCLTEIARTDGVTLDIDNLPLDDPATYRVFAEGATYGIFQFESAGMRELLRKAKPERLDDLIALNALYRPGPLKSGMVDDWVSRKQGRTEIKYELPQLRSHPVRIPTAHRYQEQVMRIAQALAGFSLGQATCFARPWARRTPIHGQAARGVHDVRARQRRQREEGTKIFDLMEYFAGYGSTSRTSTAYAFLAYQTRTSRRNYPWHFAAALLTIESQNKDKLAIYLGECREAACPCCRPTSTRALDFSVEPGRGVRFGWAR